MKKAIIALLVIAVAALGIWFFMNQMGGSNSALSKHIPENAQAVISFNVKEIALKADLKKFKDSEALKDLLKEADPAIAELIKETIENPENTGIDYATNPTLFFSIDGRRAQSGFLLKIKDSEKFSAIAKKIAPKDAKFEAIGDNNYYHEEGSKNVVIWNKGTVLMYSNPTSKTAVSRADSLLNGTASSIKNNKYYTSADMSSDIAFYMNYNELMENQKQSGMQMNPMKSLNIPTKFHLVAGIDFNEGKMEFSSNNIYENKEDAERMNFQGGPLKENLLGYITETAPIVAMQGKMNYTKLFDFFMDAKEVANSLGEISEQLGVSRGDLRNLLNGDIALAFSGLESKEVTTEFMGSTMTSSKTIPHAALYLGLGDKEVWKKMIEKSKLVKENGKYLIPFFGQIVFNIVETEAGIVIAVGDTEIDKLAKNGKMSDGKFATVDAAKQSGNEGLTYINFNAKTWPESTQAYLKKEMRDGYNKFELGMEPFNYAFGEIKNAQEGKFFIMMTDEKTNSLTQILEMSNKMYLLIKKENEERMKAYEEMMRQYENEGFEEEEEMMELDNMPEEVEIAQ